MDTGLKQRLIGAAVLVALAVIFLPMLVKGPAPDSGVSSVSLDMPDAPNGEMQTRDLPLVAPGAVPQGGAVGLDARPVDRAPTDAAAPADPNAPPADPAAAAAPADPSLPPTTAGGNFAVHFGAYASQKGADTVANVAKAAQLPAYTEPTLVGGKPAFRVRIGPYATRAEAEAVRLKAMEVRSDVPVRVVALDAEPAPAAPATAAAEAPKPTEPRPEPPKPTATAAPKPTETKPVATKPAETKPQPARPVAPASAPKVGFAVQVGVFSDPAAASAMRDRLRAAGFTAVLDTVESDNGRLTRVRVGPVIDRPAADQLKEQIRSKAGVDGFVRAYP